MRTSVENSNNKYNELKGDLEDTIYDGRFCKRTIVPELTNGYIDYKTGNESSFSPNETYKKTDFIHIPVNCEKIVFASYFNADAGAAFYDKNKKYISGITRKEKVLIDDADIAFVRFSAYRSDCNFSNIAITFFGLLSENVLNIEERLRTKSDKVYEFSEINVATLLDGVWNFNNGTVFQPQTENYKHAIIENAGFEKIKLSGFHFTDSEYNGYGFYDEQLKLISVRYFGNAIGFNEVTDVPSDCKYIYINGNNKNNTPRAYTVSNIVDVNSLKNDVDLFESKEIVKAEAPTERGYIAYNTGLYHNYDVGTDSTEPPKKYACNTEYIIIDVNINYYYDGSLEGSDAGLAFYDSNKVYISGINISNATIPLNIPKNAMYLRYSEVDKTGTGTFKGVLREVIIGKIEKEVSKYVNQIVICCTGDSVTEGMSTDGAHTADYGKSPYPARLYTILKDNGYDNVTVINQGHGGERTPDIAVRLGGFPCYFAESVTIPSNNAKTSLGTMVAVNGRATGTKIKIPYADSNGDDYCVYFTQTSHDTNPVLIDGVEYNLSISDGANYIQKVVDDGKETIIPFGSLLLPNDNKNPNVNIFYGGINDGASMTLKRWVDTMKACANANGGKYIVLGCTHPLFNSWPDLAGTFTEKYTKYRRTCIEEFGVHFIDLYDEFARHALDYALSAGYYTDKTDTELSTMRDKLANHIIPKEMSYNKASENNVHLSEEGYHVIGMLLFERLKKLNYI